MEDNNNLSAVVVCDRLLQVTMLNAQAFHRAVQYGYIQVDQKGNLHWMLGSTTLLAYFCGRMWCGDASRYSRRVQAGLWTFGKRQFPAASLNRTFGVTTLKESRNRRKNRTLPRGYEVIDSLFDNNGTGNIGGTSGEHENGDPHRITR